MGKETLSTSGSRRLVKDCKLPIDVFLLSSEGERFGAHRRLLEIFNPDLTIIKPKDQRQLAVVKLPESAKIVALLIKFSHNYPHTHLATRSIDTVFDFVVAAEKYGNQFAVEACEAAMNSNYSDAYGTYTLCRERWHESMRAYRAVFDLINAKAETHCSRGRMLADIFVAQVIDEVVPTMEKIRLAAHTADDVLPDMCFEEDYEQCYEALERVVEDLPLPNAEFEVYIPFAIIMAPDDFAEEYEHYKG
ncbi:hypothetical protein MPER_11564 [Moniliophthora perniciosa FA553]|nr:hypothetical protein MPER_11564 [Moniliophthora perniciosa FA553]